MGGAEFLDFIILILIVPLMALLGIYFLGSAVLAIYRDVLGMDDKFSEWLDRGFGTGWGLGLSEWGSGAKKLVAAGIGVLFAVLAYALFRYGVVEPVALHAFGCDLQAP